MMLMSNAPLEPILDARKCLVLVIASILLLPLLVPVNAALAAPWAVYLEDPPPGKIFISPPITLRVRVKDAMLGAPISGAQVKFYVNGIFVGSDTTGSLGYARWDYSPAMKGTFSWYATAGGATSTMWNFSYSPVEGLGGPPIIDISPPIVHFGQLKALDGGTGDPEELIRILNRGSGVLRISSVSYPEPPFFLHLQPPIPAEVQPGESLEMAVKFVTGYGRGDFDSSILIFSNDPGRPTVAVGLKGSVTAPPPPSPVSMLPLYAIFGGLGAASAALAGTLYLRRRWPELRAKRPAIMKAPSLQPNLRVCPKCAHSNPPDASSCKNCGAPWDDTVVY